MDGALNLPQDIAKNGATATPVSSYVQYLDFIPHFDILSSGFSLSRIGKSEAFSDVARSGRTCRSRVRYALSSFDIFEFFTPPRSISKL